MKYDIIVIGAGSGGLNIAGFMNKAGFKTLLIDRSDRHIGGDCLNYGCIPSKAFIHISRLVHNAQISQEFGIGINGSIDMKKVMNYVDSKREIIRTHENAEYFRKKGMDVALGNAEFAGPSSVSVDGKVFEGKKIVIATGSRPREMQVSGVEKVKYYTNENIFDIDFLPGTMIIIGGGPIGIELGQAFSRLGSTVKVIEQGSQFLPKEVPQIAEILHSSLIQEGMEFHFRTRIKEFSSPNNLIVIDENNNETTMHFDAVLFSIGRDLNLEGLQLQKAGIRMNNGRLETDNRLRTTNKNVLVCGDAAGSYQFTHAAEYHAGIILNNFFSPFKRKLNNDYLSWVTYTSPEIATFGLNEAELKKRGTDYTTLSMDLKNDDRAIVDGTVNGKIILHLHKNRIIGGSVVAENAGETFQELVLAMHSRLHIKNIFNKIYPYPTAARINKSAIVQYFSGKLTPFTKKFLRLMYR